MVHFDLAILGSGSGNTLVTPAWDGKRVALVESGTFGGTCLNVGCIPTKMYVYAAEIAQTVREAARYGIDAHIDGVRWPAIRDRIFDRIDPISSDGQQVRRTAENVTLFAGVGSFDGPRSIYVEADGITTAKFTASQVVIATGSRPVVPPIVAESGVAFHTSDTIMRIAELPETLLILGGGYVSAEFAHIFSSLGVSVKVLTRGPALLTAQDGEISQRFTALAQAKWDVELNADVTAVRGNASEVLLDLAGGKTVTGSMLLVATGRQPNSDRLNLDQAGVSRRDDGRVWVDDFGRTTAERVWALGDVSSAFQLKHVANSEARTVAHNLTVGHGDRDGDGELKRLRHRFVPSAVFTDPQIAAVGATGQQLEAGSRRFVTATQPYSDTAFGWAMEDRTGVCRLYADPATGELLGAHILGPQAATLIQPLIQAMTFGQTVAEISRNQFWIHPSLTEVIERALLQLPMDDQ